MNTPATRQRQSTAPARPTGHDSAPSGAASPQKGAQALVLILPWPPTINTYWRRVGNRTILSKVARDFRAAALSELHGVQRFAPEHRLRVHLFLNPPTRQAFDVDNRAKGPLDALQHAGVIPDDSQVDFLSIERGPVIKKGRLTVTIETIKEEA